MTREDAKDIKNLWFGEYIKYSTLCRIIDNIFDDFELRTCDTCTHCDKSTLTQLKQAYCNKLQISISDYDKFYCAYWKE